MFYDVYCRPAASTILSLEGDFILGTLRKIKLLDGGAKLSFEPELREMGDGTPRVTAENVSLECASLRVSVAEYDYLRTSVHNALNDLLFMDPHDMRLCIAVYRMRLNVQLVAKSKDVAIINITGSIQAGASVIDSQRVEVFQLDDGSHYALLSGRVIDENGTPIPGATVIVDTGNMVFTCEEGEFNVIVTNLSTTVEVDAAGHTFPGLSISPDPGQVYNITIKGIKD